MSKNIHTIIFDLGGVLIDWNPKYLYRKIFQTEDEIDWFLNNICTGEWNDEQDAGRSFEQAVQELVSQHPDWEDHIRAYFERWEEMVGGLIQETVTILERIKNTTDYKLYALTNWSAETFPMAKERYPFLSWFEGIVVSGHEKTRKPFAVFYEILFDRFNIDPHTALFIDDNIKNIEGARSVGLNVIHFSSPAQLKADLESLNILCS